MTDGDEQPPGSPYWMTLSLNVLNHLGINLYSSLPAVLSEAVANAWDADATTVSVSIDVTNDRIEIVDNGVGMTLDEINGRFLHVGYRRREDSGAGAGAISARLKRPVMGRKGIGKLSLFSIARTVEVYSSARRPLDDPTAPLQRNAFLMDVDAIEEAIHGEGTGYDAQVYRPEPLSTDDMAGGEGTRIVLGRLKKSPSRTAQFLTKRLARRFSMLGRGFTLTVDGQPVTAADRKLQSTARYLWIYGPPAYIADVRKTVSTEIQVFDRPTIDYKGSPLTGWIGSARSSTDLRSAGDGDEHMNRISVFVRDKLAQEDLLRTSDHGGLFTKYLFGELHADFLDLDDEDDIATSSRQSIVEDDPRYEQVVTFLQQELRHLEKAWSKLREDEGETEARRVIAIDDWYKTLDSKDRPAARALFGKIRAIPGEGEQRRRLYASGVLAFEGLRRRRRLALIEESSTENIPALINAFESLDDIEAAVFYEVVKDRLSIIRKFEDLLDDDVKERTLQQYLFDHLWLLDPSWERTTIPIMERTVRKIIEGVSDKDQSVLNSRIDIGYRQASASHVIVELKRASVVTDTYTLLAQIAKYRDGVVSYLRQTEGEHVDLQIVIVVGRDLTDWKSADGVGNSREMLKVQDARVITYDRLVRDALATYQEYLDANRELGPVRELLSRIEDELTPPSAETVQSTARDA